MTMYNAIVYPNPVNPNPNHCAAVYLNCCCNTKQIPENAFSGAPRPVQLMLIVLSTKMATAGATGKEEPNRPGEDSVQDQVH